MENLLVPLEFKNQRILTTQQIADFYETEPKNIRDNFENNKNKFIETRDYYLLKGEYLKEFKRQVENFGVPIVSRFAKHLYLWTEYGAVLHAKSINTDSAWDVYFKLIDTYFRAKTKQVKMFTFNDIPCTSVREIAKKYRCSDSIIQDYLKRIPLEKDYSYVMGEDLKIFKEENKLDPHISCLYIIYETGISKVEKYLIKQGYSNVKQLGVV